MGGAQNFVLKIIQWPLSDKEMLACKKQRVCMYNDHLKDILTAYLIKKINHIQICIVIL